VIHLAALVAPKPAFAEAYAVNVDGALNVARAARACGRLVHVSSPSVAFDHEGAIGAAALPPTYGGSDVYARTKALGERAVLGVSGLSTLVIRPHLVYGPGDEQLVGRLLNRALSGRLALPGTGAALIDTTYIDDAAAAIVAALDRTADAPELSGSSFVVSGGDPRPVVEVVTAILAAFGLNSTVKHLPVGLAKTIGRACDKFWPGAEPPLTEFAVEQLSLAHSFDLRATAEALGVTPQWSFDRSMRALADFAGTEAGHEFLNRHRHRTRR
jgi:nucleoside-diphosphate-sugar epimerase